MKILVFIFFVITLIYSNQFVDAALTQGVETIGPVRKYKFECDPKTGEAKKAKTMQFANFKNLQTSVEKITNCPIGTCDSATPGKLSVKDKPFVDKKVGAANQILIKGKKKMCKDMKVAQQEGKKKMDFVDPLPNEDNIKRLREMMKEADKNKNSPTVPINPEISSAWCLAYSEEDTRCGGS